jgi:hypothetical protein
VVDFGAAHVGRRVTGDDAFGDAVVVEAGQRRQPASDLEGIRPSLSIQRANNSR